MLQNPGQVWNRAQGGKKGAVLRTAVGILAATAAASGPQPKAELAHVAQCHQDPVKMETMSVALEELDAQALQFREKSRPLLDDGDGKLSEVAVLLRDEAAEDDEGTTTKNRTRRGRRGQGRAKQGQRQAASTSGTTAHSSTKRQLQCPEKAPIEQTRVETPCAPLVQADNMGSTLDPTSAITVVGNPASANSKAGNTSATPVAGNPTSARTAGNNTSATMAGQITSVTMAGQAQPTTGSETRLPGLVQPTMDSGDPVTGAAKERHRLENKRRRQHKQAVQPSVLYWATHKGDFRIPTPKQAPTKYKGSMSSSGLALHHQHQTYC